MSTILHPDNMDNATVAQLLDEMGRMNADCVRIVIGRRNNPIAAAILVRGPDTQGYLEAIEAKDQELGKA